ncbi:hypothetical protein [Nostoc sp.]
MGRSEGTNTPGIKNDAFLADSGRAYFCNIASTKARNNITIATSV